MELKRPLSLAHFLEFIESTKIRGKSVDLLPRDSHLSCPQFRLPHILYSSRGEVIESGSTGRDALRPDNAVGRIDSSVSIDMCNEERRTPRYYAKPRYSDWSLYGVTLESIPTTHFHVFANCRLGYNRDICIRRSVKFWLICPLALITLSICAATICSFADSAAGISRWYGAR